VQNRRLYTKNSARTQAQELSSYINELVLLSSNTLVEEVHCTNHSFSRGA